MGFVSVTGLGGGLPGYSEFLQLRGEVSASGNQALRVLSQFRDGRFRSEVSSRFVIPIVNPTKCQAPVAIKTVPTKLSCVEILAAHGLHRLTEERFDLTNLRGHSLSADACRLAHGGTIAHQLAVATGVGPPRVLAIRRDLEHEATDQTFVRRIAGSGRMGILGRPAARSRCRWTAGAASGATSAGEP
jgi:hypothetical protein